MYEYFNKQKNRDIISSKVLAKQLGYLHLIAFIYICELNRNPGEFIEFIIQDSGPKFEKCAIFIKLIHF